MTTNDLPILFDVSPLFALGIKLGLDPEAARTWEGLALGTNALHVAIVELRLKTGAALPPLRFLELIVLSCENIAACAEIVPSPPNHFAYYEAFSILSEHMVWLSDAALHPLPASVLDRIDDALHRIQIATDILPSCPDTATNGPSTFRTPLLQLLLGP